MSLNRSCLFRYAQFTKVLANCASKLANDTEASEKERGSSLSALAIALPDSEQEVSSHRALAPAHITPNRRCGSTEPEY